MPPENNQFDFDSLSDVILHLGYTAREGGEVLRRLANESAQKHLPGAGLRLFDLRHDFPDAWHHLQAGRRQKLFPFAVGREHFPYLPADRRVWVDHVEIFFEVARPQGDGHEVVHFVSDHEHRHASAEDCDCGGHNIECVASADWPHLYHGVLDLDLGLLDRRNGRELGVFRFPGGPGSPRRVYLMCGFKTELAPRLPAGEQFLALRNPERDARHRPALALPP